jgi:hypothetical protein
VIGRLPDEMSALSLIFGVLEEDRLMWRGVKMNDDVRQAVAHAFKTACEEPITITWAEELPSA